jgi:hypothetical protein
MRKHNPIGIASSKYPQKPASSDIGGTDLNPKSFREPLHFLRCYPHWENSDLLCANTIKAYVWTAHDI